MTRLEFAIAQQALGTLASRLAVELKLDADAVAQGEELTLDQIAIEGRKVGHFGRLVLEAGGGR